MENVPDTHILKMMSDEEGKSTSSETEKIEIEMKKQQEEGKEDSVKEYIKIYCSFIKK